MGREIRRVPPDWQHPKEDRHGRNDYKPLYDNDYQSAAKEWIDAFDLWRAGKHPNQSDYCQYYWEYSAPPDEETHRARAWTPEEATAYQMYETVSEGTPVSPVFETLDELVSWLVSQGHSEHAARQFAASGWAPSMVMHRSSAGVTIASNIDMYDLQ